MGYQHQHAGLLAALRSVYGRHGVRGLWRGSASALPRVMVGSAAQLTTFSAALEYIERAQVRLGHGDPATRGLRRTSERG